MWLPFESSKFDQSTVPTPIAGQWSQGTVRREIRSPFDGRLVGVVPECSASDVDRAVLSAGEALRRGLPAWRRAEVLDTAAARLRDHRENFARLISDESAKPIRTARVEVDRAISTLQFSSVEARSLAGEMIPMDASPSGQGRLGFTLRVPIGIVGAITPFNFPLNLVVHKVGPAIASGCPIVLKPAGQTPLTSIALATMLIEECDLPPDWMHVVPGPGNVVGHAIVDHPAVSLITFTGSPDVGWNIRSRAPKKRVGLELGNNAPVIIEPDGDWEAAVSKIRVAGFSHAGQSCISTQRILVHSSIYDSFLNGLEHEVAAIVVGDPSLEETEVSSLISRNERDRVCAWIAEATDNGGRIVVGGSVGEDGILRPTILADADPNAKVCRGEIFGPVVVVNSYESFSDALEMANDSEFGLQAAVFTSRLDVALQALRELDFGGVIVNDVPTYRADQQPYGGLRESGNTREGPAWSVREMTELKMVIING